MAYPMPAKPIRAEEKPLSTPLAGGQRKEGGSWVKGLITLIVVLVIIGGGIYLIANYTGIGSGLLFGGESFQSEWQAIFLTNGQVYFGKVAKIDDSFIYLTDIYYLQVVTSQNTIGQPPDVQTQPEQRLTLIKMGNEIHGPRDEMRINRDHVVLIEDLKDDGRVVKAISDYLTQPPAEAAPQQ